VLAHGSKDVRWQHPFNELTAELKARLGVDSVRLAYMEFISPTLSDVAAEAVRDGKLELLVLPLFLAAGAHLAEDIPAQVADARMHFPQLQIKLVPPIGEHPRVKALFQEIACEYARA
jgi:sirohydrochlorin cobaltochelatase